MKLSLSFLLILAQLSFGTTLLSSVLSGTDFTTYMENANSDLVAIPNVSATDPILSSIILSGSAGAAGGNIELFAGSDGLTDMSQGGAFANVAPVVLNTSHTGGSTIEVRSLNGQDWFVDTQMAYNLNYGADNLANRYYEDLRQAIIAASTDPFVSAALSLPSNIQSGFEQFRDNGGFAQLSDPNVSYVRFDANGLPVVGLAGFEDVTQRMLQLSGVGDPALVAIAFANGLQASELAIVNGEAVYGFSAVPSGVVLQDGLASYGATYELSIPEPSVFWLLGLGGLALVCKRKR